MISSATAEKYLKRPPFSLIEGEESVTDQSSGTSDIRLDRFIAIDAGSGTLFGGETGFVNLPATYTIPGIIEPLSIRVKSTAEVRASTDLGISVWRNYKPGEFRLLLTVISTLDEVFEGDYRLVQQQYNSQINSLWRTATYEDFEDGIGTGFDSGIAMLLKHGGIDALKALEICIRKEAKNLYISAEALKSIGRVEDVETHEARRTLLEGFVEHDSALFRESAALGLENLDDRAAVTALRNRLNKESDPRLRLDLAAVIRFLLR